MMRGTVMTLVAVVGGVALCLVGGAADRHTTPADPAPAGRHYSPMAPLRIEMTPLPARKGDGKGQRRLTVRVTPLVDAPKLEVTLTLPPGVTLVRGETLWEAPARAGAAQTRELLMKVPSAGEQRVVVVAELLFKKALPMANVASYMFNRKVATPRREGTPPEPYIVPTIPVTPAPRDR